MAIGGTSSPLAPSIRTLSKVRQGDPASEFASEDLQRKKFKAEDYMKIEN